MKSLRVFMHDYEKARRDAARNHNQPLLQFTDGTQHILLPTGQHINKDPKPPSKKERRRQRKLLADA